MKRADRRHIGGVLGFAFVCLAGTASAAIGLGDDARIDPNDFRITVFADDLPYPTSMQRLDDGSLLVATNDPSGGLFDSTGELVRLVDADDDGVADGPPTVLATGLPGVATSVRRSRDLVFVSSQEIDNETLSILRVGAAPGDAYTLLGEIELGFPVPGAISNHRNVALAVRDTPGAGTVDLFFNLGAEGSAVATAATVAGGGLLSGVPGAAAMNMDSIWKVTVQDTGGVPVLSDLIQVAAGLRNAAGIAFDSSGALWFSENGMDFSDPVKSADELNRLDPDDVGGAIEDFGFPDDYVEYQTGVIGTGLSVQPLVAFQPIPDPNTGDQSEGAVEIAHAPAGFPVGLRNGIFIGFHGEFSNTGVGNDENVVVYVDAETFEYFHFVPVTEPSIGHPNGLLATERSLFIADLTSTGSIFGDTESGRIHQIRAIATPVPLLGNAFALVVLATVLLGAVSAIRIA